MFIFGREFKFIFILITFYLHYSKISAINSLHLWRGKSEFIPSEGKGAFEATKVHSHTLMTNLGLQIWTFAPFERKDEFIHL